MKPCRCLVAARPPTPLLLSNTVTAFPASRSTCAAASPLHPAPIMAIDFSVLLFPDGFIAPLPKTSPNIDKATFRVWFLVLPGPFHLSLLRSQSGPVPRRQFPCNSRYAHIRQVRLSSVPR